MSLVKYDLNFDFTHLIFVSFLQGNECKKLLDNLSFLSDEMPAELYDYYVTFQTFNMVVSASFGDILDPNYDTYIDQFKIDYLKPLGT